MWRSTIPPKLHLIHLKNTPIFEQLQLEEALLRTDDRNFCIINQGSPRAIVMGISGDPHTLLNVDLVSKDQIPVIKRFSGGGTVIVDENTLFITFILSKDLFDIPAFPEPILRWSAEVYERAWQIPHFHLRENDYCIAERKCGGNAQYIKKDRWLHHTSFLWDYSEQNMEYLSLPAKRPKYRENRSHKDFLTRLKEHHPSADGLIEQLKIALQSPKTEAVSGDPFASNVKPQYTTPKTEAVSGDPSASNVKPQYTTPKTEAVSGDPSASNVKPLYICDFDLGQLEIKPHRQSTQFVHF